MFFYAGFEKRWKTNALKKLQQVCSREDASSLLSETLRRAFAHDVPDDCIHELLVHFVPMLDLNCSAVRLSQGRASHDSSATSLDSPKSDATDFHCVICGDAAYGGLCPVCMEQARTVFCEKHFNEHCSHYLQDSGSCMCQGSFNLDLGRRSPFDGICGCI